MKKTAIPAPEINIFNWMDYAPAPKPEDATFLETITEVEVKSSSVLKTPLMKQYEEMKKKHPDAILLFRVGNFYEIFGDDARDASQILDITLTTRANGAKGARIYLAGFPHHALDTHLPKLVRAGRRVAICEQLEDPKLSRKLVKRGINTTETPKTV